MALVVLALLFFSGILTYQIGRTAAAAAESTREANRANQESIVAQEMLGLARSLLFGTYGEADPETERAAKALEIFEDEIGRIQMDVKQTPLVQAKIAESIGAVYVALGRYRQAELLFSKSLEIRRDYLGREHIETVESILRLADLHKALGSIKEAEPLYQDALGALSETKGEDYSGLAPVLTALGDIYHELDRLEEAESAYRRAVEIICLAELSSPIEIANSLVDLADLISMDLSRLADAERLYRRALRILVGSEDKNIDYGLARILAGLGFICKYSGRLEESAVLFHWFRQVSERAVKNNYNSPYTSRSYRQLASPHWFSFEISEQGSKWEEEFLVSVLEHYQESLGPRYRSIGRLHSRVADFYRSKGRNEEAEASYLRALAIFEGILGPDHFRLVGPLTGLAILYQGSGRVAEGELFFNRARAIYQNPAGFKSLESWKIRQRLGIYLCLTGRDAEAKELGFKKGSSSSCNGAASQLSG